MDKIRCGIIGVGGMGRNHAGYIQELGVTELVALCDVDRERLQEMAKEFHISNLYTDYHDMIEDESIDAVSICTPHYLHGPISIEAMAARKHVITEKPMAITLEQADRMIETSKKNKVFLGCSEEHRFAPQVQIARRWIKEGRLGRIFRCVYERRTGYSSFFTGRERPSASAWRSKKYMMGGGVFMDLGHHAVDTVRYLMGDLTTCFACTANLLGEGEGEDTIIAVYKHEDSWTSQIYIGPGPRTWCVMVIGSKGAVKVEPIRGAATVSFFGAETVEEVKAKEERSKGTALEKFFESILECKPLEYPPEESRKSLAGVLAAYESEEKGLSVRVKD